VWEPQVANIDRVDCHIRPVTRIDGGRQFGPEFGRKRKTEVNITSVLRPGTSDRFFDSVRKASNTVRDPKSLHCAKSRQTTQALAWMWRHFRVTHYLLQPLRITVKF